MQYGTVKWFAPQKGYGFITGDDGVDAFVHQSEIRKEGFRSLDTGDRVGYETIVTEKGMSAVGVASEGEE